MRATNTPFIIQMATTNLNHKRDFALIIDSDAGFANPFALRFFTSRPVSAMVVGRDTNGNLYGCSVLEDGRLLVPFDNFCASNRQGIGYLMVEPTTMLPNNTYPDGYEHQVLSARRVEASIASDDDDDDDDESVTEIFIGLTDDTDDVDFNVSLPINWMKGADADIAGANAAIASANAAASSANSAAASASSIASQVQSAESDRVSAEQTRVSAETARISAETSRSSAEQSRVSAEESRVSAEKSRVTYETNRGKAEMTRQMREEQRQAAEQTRESNESARQSAEATRQATFETNEATRQSTFDSKESERDAAVAAAAQAADQLEDLAQNLSHFKVSLDGTTLSVTDTNNVTKTIDVKGKDALSFQYPSNILVHTDADGMCKAQTISVKLSLYKGGALSKSIVNAELVVSGVATKNSNGGFTVVVEENIMGGGIPFSSQDYADPVSSVTLTNALTTSNRLISPSAKIKLRYTYEGTTTSVEFPISVVEVADGATITKTSQLTNDSGYITTADYDAIADIVAAKFTDVSVNGQ